MSRYPGHYRISVDTAANLTARGDNFATGDVAFVAEFGYDFIFDSTSSAVTASGSVIDGKNSNGRWIATSKVQKRTIDIPLATLQAQPAGLTYAATDTSALPTNAKVLGCVLTALSLFTGAGLGSAVLDVGVAGANDVLTSVDLMAGAAPKSGNAGTLGFVGAPAVGTFNVLITTTVVDVTDLTAGAVTIVLYYYILP